MTSYYAITNFLQRIERLEKVRRGVYTGVRAEIQKEFKDKSIEEIRINRDMILSENDLIVIELRLPDKKQRLSKKDGYRLIYLVSKINATVVFLDVYPKNGPSRQISITEGDLKQLLSSFIEEMQNNTLSSYPIQ